jgi:hypothetical protein
MWAVLLFGHLLFSPTRELLEAAACKSGSAELWVRRLDDSILGFSLPRWNSG